MSPRNFAVLALATVASIALAIQAVRQHDMPVQTAAAGEPLFPSLLDRLNDVREIRITTPAGPLTLTMTDGGWVLAEKAGYPADPTQVRNLALSLANLRLIEPRTADPERLPRLELEEPGVEGAKSRLIELEGTDGAMMAAAVIGKGSPSLYGDGRGGVYVRRAGDNQAWLTAGELDLPTDASGLIEQEVVDIPLDQVARVIVQPPGAAAVTISRPDVSVEFASDTALPDGRKLDPVKVEALAGALAGLTMSDVRPAGEITGQPQAQRNRFETFQGLAIEVTVVRLGEGDGAEHWLTLAATSSATATTGQANATSTPTDPAPPLVRKLDGWAFKVPPYLADRLGVGLDQLLAEPSPAS